MSFTKDLFFTIGSPIKLLEFVFALLVSTILFNLCSRSVFAIDHGITAIDNKVGNMYALRGKISEKLRRKDLRVTCQLLLFICI